MTVAIKQWQNLVFGVKGDISCKVFMKKKRKKRKAASPNFESKKPFWYEDGNDFETLLIQTSF